MKNLGRILFIIFVVKLFAFAGIVASVDSSNVTEGDVVTFSLNLTGTNIQKPNLTSVCGENIVATGSSTSIQSVNGYYYKTYTLTYRFVAAKSCTIQPVTLEIDGVKESSKPIDVSVSKYVPSKDDDFYLTLQSDKSEIYVGEPFQVTLVLKQKNNVRVVDSKFDAPSFNGFWVKGSPVEQTTQDQNSIFTKLTYKIAPQRKGFIHIDPAKISVATRVRGNNYWGNMFQDVKWKNYFSNGLDIKVRELPENVKLVGDFKIESFADKKEVSANEAINVTVKVSGTGNLEDIESFKPYVDGVSVFDENILIKENVLTQKITFVADSNFVIPSFSLEYFDLNTKNKSIIKTQPIQITVKNAKEQTDLNVKKSDEVEVVKRQKIVFETDLKTLLYWFIGGIFLGVFATLLLTKKIQFKKEAKIDLNDHKSLVVKLMPFAQNDNEVKSMIDLIENNAYSKNSEKVDKKRLKQIIEKYKIR